MNELAHYNHLSYCYDYYDGTSVSSEVFEQINNMSDLFYTLSLREEQRLKFNLSGGEL